jgi:hypothetical protein
MGRETQSTTYSKDYKYSSKQAGEWEYTVTITNNTRLMSVAANEITPGMYKLNPVLPNDTQWNPANMEGSIKKFVFLVNKSFQTAVAEAELEAFNPRPILDKLGFRESRI